MVQTAAAQDVPNLESPSPPLPDIPMPDLPPVPELTAVPEPVMTPPTPTPRPAPLRPTPPQPPVVNYEDFLRSNPLREPRQRQPVTRQPVTVPKIDAPRLVVPTNPSPAVNSPRPLTQQQLSALGTYSAKLRSRIDAAWAKPGSLAGALVAATVVFDVSATGRITNARLDPRSGNSAFDQSVLAAFRKVISAGPTPTGQGHSFTMTFRMSD